jgi:3-deoxy-manno-octulosonate cytidylyltransferase (CMP-KDO synthetase)
MATHPKCYGIIPARFDSTRFPGKPLADILGKPMFWHVYHQASKCPDLTQVILATDNDDIYNAANKLDVPVVMTRKDHASGTDRVLEAARQISAQPDEIVVNIQGDEPLLESEMLTSLLSPFSNPNVSVTTLASEIDLTDAKNPDRVKVIFAKNGNALLFSRALIPFPRNNDPKHKWYVHIGLYAFRMNTLETFVSLGPSQLETIEQLEQLRLLEHNIPIQVVTTYYNGIGVDRPEDLEKVREILSKKK